jgi:simple sugar transport system permease protein
VTLITAGALAASAATVTLILLALGSDPLAVADTTADAAFGGRYEIGQTVNDAIPRLLIGLGVAVALRAGLWNIGAEGQMYIGAIACVAVVMSLPELPLLLAPVLGLVAAACAGAVWGGVPGVMKARRGTNEIITTLMLVYVAIQLVSYMLEKVWTVEGSTYPATRALTEDERFPLLIDGALLRLDVLIAVALIPLTWFLVTRTSWGMRLRAVGSAPKAAAAMGGHVHRTWIVALATSGAYAGLVGGIQVVGIFGKLIEGFSPGYGFEGIAVALIGRLNPIGIALAALLFGAFDAGGAGLRTTGETIPTSIVAIAEGLTVIYVLLGQGIWERRTRKRRAQETLSHAAGAHEPPGGDLAVTDGA